MDFFGTGAALLAAQEICFQSARRTGRTTRMLEHLKSGDRIVTQDNQAARRLRDEVARTGKLIDVVVSEPRYLPRNLPVLDEQRTVLDHTFVEEFYRQQLKETFAWVRDFEAAHGNKGLVHTPVLRWKLE